MYPSQYLSTKRNREAPVSKLSEDILLRIFTFARAADPEDPRTPLRRITHVCRDWRDVAIEAPLLWTHCLSSSRPKWTTLALQRTQRAPMASLEIDLHLQHGISDVSKALLAHTSHTSNLKMSGRARHLIAAQEMMADEASFLKKLHIPCKHDNHSDTDDGLAPRFELSPTKFRHTHHLRILELERVDIDFGSPLLRNLTTLSLRRVSPESLPTWPQLIELLHRMPLLGHLTLEHVFPRVDSSALSLKPACLPLLDYLYIECTAASQMQTILSYVFFLRPEELRLRWHEDDVDHTSTFRTIGVAVHAKQFGNTFNKLEAEMFDNDRSLSLVAASSRKGSSIHVSVPSSAETDETVIIAAFVDLLCLQDVTKLDLALAMFKDYDHDALLLLAGKMPFLKGVSISFFTAFDFFEVLGMKCGTSHSQTQQICLPDLESFAFMISNFSGREEWVESDAMKVLATRREQGAELEYLSFDYCEDLSPEMVSIFEEEVEQVYADWDT